MGATDDRSDASGAEDLQAPRRVRWPADEVRAREPAMGEMLARLNC